jgi:hypothetical protein
MNILILGGYGYAGLAVARLLAGIEGNHRVMLGGRNEQKCREATSALGLPSGSGRQMDASSGSSLRENLSDVDLLLVASSSTQWAETVIRACLDSGCDYFDIQMPFPEKHRALNRHREEIEKKKRTFVTDGGFHPGVPAAMVRWAGLHLEELEKVEIGCMVRADWGKLRFSSDTIVEMVEELHYYEPKIVRNRQVQRVKAGSSKRIQFSKSKAKTPCAAMWLPELAALPSMFPALTEVGFYISGFNPVTDLATIPLVLAALKIAPGFSKARLGSLLSWSLRNFSKPPYRTQINMQAYGIVQGTRCRQILNISHPDPYTMTAIPVVAAIKQYLQAPGARPGLWFQGQYVEPVGFMRDLAALGAEMTYLNPTER